MEHMGGTEKKVSPKKKLIEGLDYYIENGKWVFTEYYLKNRQYCCKSGCRHCPYGYNKEKGKYGK